MHRLVLGLVAALALGCGGGGGGESNVGKVAMPIEQLPAAFLKTARDKLPDVKFNEVWKKPNGDLEIRGKNKLGKVREVEINSQGEVLAIE